MNSSEIIKKMRVTMCMEQKEFAALLGVSVSSVSHYETNVRKPRLPVIKKIIDLARKNKIKVSVEDFLP